jgi:hypothetical protein
MTTIGNSPLFTPRVGSSPQADGAGGVESAKGAGGAKIVDALPQVATFVAQSLGVPELPAADLVLMGSDGLALLANFFAGESREEVIKPLLESLLSRGASVASQEIARNAGGAFQGDVGQFLEAISEGVVKAIANDPGGTAQLAFEIGRVVATAIATGGASLASDLPALAPKLMTAAAAVLNESGIDLDAMMTQVTANFLSFIGVEEATAQTLARVSVSLLTLGVDVALAVASEGKHKIPPERLENAVREIAVATGVEPDKAAVVAAAAAAAFTFGQNMYGYLSGGGDLKAYGGLDKIADVATDAVRTWMEQGGASLEDIQATVTQLSPLIQSFLDTVRQDMSTSSERSGQGWADLNKTLLQWNPAFGNVFDDINALNQLTA